MTRKKKSKTNIGHYAVAFIDLMGQQERLRELKDIPEKDNAEQREEFHEVLRNTYGAVQNMRKVFNQFFSEFGKQTIDITKIPKEKKRIFKSMKSNPVRFHQFSDFVTAFVSLRTDQGAKLPIHGIYGLIGATAATSLTSLAAGHPIRGGIDIGIGVEMKHTEIYGSALSRVYTLETHVAGYPRVVIGKEMQSFLEVMSEQPQTDEISAVSAQVAHHCMEMLAIDDDGYAFVDFIGQGTRQQLEGMEEDAAILVRRAYEFVSEALLDFKLKRDSKLAFKYSLLRNYMKPRLEIWGLKP